MTIDAMIENSVNELYSDGRVFGDKARAPKYAEEVKNITQEVGNKELENKATELFQRLGQGEG